MAGFRAVEIKEHSHARNCLSAAAKIRVLPIAAGRLWLNQENVSGYFPLQSRHDLRQLTHAGAGAWAMRMGQHHQGGTVSGPDDLGRRPFLRKSSNGSRRIFVLEQGSQPKSYRCDPCDREQ